MTEKISTTLRESSVARWAALLLLSSTMFFAYMFIDVLAPLSTMLEQSLKWTPDTFGSVAGSEYFLNVFAFFLIFAGIILDKMGVRFTAVLAAVVMVAGASIKLYGISDAFNNGGFGYDPIFFVPTEGKTAAELTREEKSAISHRGRALKLLLEALRNG